MDLVSLMFYGAVCGVLALLSPVVGNGLTRLIVGIGIGVGSAFALPGLRPFLEDMVTTYMGAAPGT